MSKILLVEDNEMNRDMVSRRLARHGFQVICATNGQEGIELARSQNADLILMDLSLPVMDGWEALRRMKADPSIEKIPVIALTAHALSSDRDDALRVGFNGYESKPIDFPRLIEKMKALIHSHSR
jgi:two-component system cell cycle response regulator DivK